MPIIKCIPPPRKRLDEVFKLVGQLKKKYGGSKKVAQVLGEIERVLG